MADLPSGKKQNNNNNQKQKQCSLLYKVKERLPMCMCYFKTESLYLSTSQTGSVKAANSSLLGFQTPYALQFAETNESSFNTCVRTDNIIFH